MQNATLKKCKIVLNVPLIKKKLSYQSPFKEKKLKICTYMYILQGDLLIPVHLKTHEIQFNLRVNLYTCSTYTRTGSSWHGISITIPLNIEFLALNSINPMVSFLFNYLEAAMHFIRYSRVVILEQWSFNKSSL